MRILHLDTGREMRGGQWQVLRLLEGLATGGTECTLLARRDGPLFEAARKRGFRVEPLVWRRLASEARRHDVVHAHDARSHTMAALAGGAPLVVARRVAFDVKAGAASRWKYGRPRRYVAVSKFVKGILVKAGVAEERIAVVYDGVPLLPQSAGERVVTPADGGDPMKGAPMAAQAAELASFPLCGSVNLEEDLKTAGVFVYITYSEGLGSGVLLAMSAGVAVVASDVDGLREVIEPGVNGVLVENTPSAIGKAVRELLDHPDLARRLGEEARQTVGRRFTVEKMVRETMEVYRQVLT